MTNQHITAIDTFVFSILLFISIDAIICGFIGLTTNNAKKMPKLLIRFFFNRVEKAKLKYENNKRKNKVYETFFSFKAISVYFLIGGIQFIIYLAQVIILRLLNLY